MFSRWATAIWSRSTKPSCGAMPWPFELLLDGGKEEEALALYRGDLLEGFHLCGVSQVRALAGEESGHACGTAAVQAALAHSATLEGQGDLSEAAYWTRRACGWAPYDEGTLRSLCQRLVRCGDRNGAVREYEGFVARLRAELDLEPEAETVELMDRLRREGNSTARGDSVRKGKSSSSDPPASSDLEGPDEDQEAVRPRAEAGRWIWIAAAVVAAVGVSVQRLGAAYLGSCRLGRRSRHDGVV